MPSVDSSKRALLRGQMGKQAVSVFFPPWAVQDFTDRCTRCNVCVEVCEERILVKGDGGFPQVDFSLGGCDFCGICANSCEHGALVNDGERPWGLLARLDSERCLSSQGITCRTCDDQCDIRAIRFRLQTGGRSTPQINPFECNGCGACLAVCPANAVRLEEAA